MKFFYIAVICVLSVAAFAQGEENAKVQLIEDVTKCGETTGITIEEMEKIMKHEKPETKAGYCTMACVMEKYDMLTDDNKMNVEAFKEFMTKVSGEKDLPEEVITAIKECDAEIKAHEDKCDAAKEILGCLVPKVKELKNKGIFKKKE